MTGRKLGVALILTLMFSFLIMPVAGADDSGKAVIKNMVQSPADYSVGIGVYDYLIYDLWGRAYLGNSDIYGRVYANLGDVFWRLTLPPL